MKTRPSASAAIAGAAALMIGIGGLGGLGGLGCSDGGGDAMPDAMQLPDGATPRQTINESILLGINETIESIMVGGAGDAARIHATVPSLSLDWNLHGHAGGGTQVVQEGFKQMVVDYDFSPTAQADWYLLLRNKGQTDVMVELKVELFGNMQWSGRQ